MFKRFVFDRKVDISGVSGTGIIVEGIQFSDGTVAVRWKTGIASTSFFSCIEDAIKIHGHGGATELVWVDQNDTV